jgi:hypothetical protein
MEFSKLADQTTINCRLSNVRKSDVRFICIKWKTRNFSRRGLSCVYLELQRLGKLFSKQRKNRVLASTFVPRGLPSQYLGHSGMTAGTSFFLSDCSDYFSVKQHQCRESERFSFGSWFSIDGWCRGSVTWPKE